MSERVPESTEVHSRSGTTNRERPVRADSPKREDRHVVDRSDFDPNYNPDAPIECEMCGGEMRYTAACKILCSNCGYRRDCSDP